MSWAPDPWLTRRVIGYLHNTRYGANMMRVQWFRLIATGAIAVAALTTGGCKKKKEQATTTAAGSASASVSAATSAEPPKRQPRAVHPMPEGQPLSFATSDGVTIAATKWSAGPDSAPVVVLLHRFLGTKDEWKPLVQRLIPAKYPMNIVAYDARIHGASTAKPGSKAAKQTAHDTTTDQMVQDLAGLHKLLTTPPHEPPSKWLLVGSSYGASVAVMYTNEHPKDVAGLALVSPGAGIRNALIYRPFAAALALPNLILGSKQDTIAAEPLKVLAAMSKTSQSIGYDVPGHGAQQLGKNSWEMWDDLANWVEQRVEPTPAPPSSSASAQPVSDSLRESLSPPASAPPSQPSAPSPNPQRHPVR